MIDSHCHINDDLYYKNPDKYVLDAQKEGVNGFLVVAWDYASSLKAVEIANKFDNCYAAVGIHPSDSIKANEGDLERIEELLKENKVIAIGEIGLDYYWEKDEKNKEIQRQYFIKQIDLANKYNLPVSIHCRDAYGECLEILKAHKVNKGGVMHCYAGSLEMAIEFIKLGFVIGIGGTSTFKNAVKVKEVVSNIPDNTFVLETDAPYLAPTPHRGEVNHSKYIPLILNNVAELRNSSVSQIEKETDETFKRIFL